MAVPQYIQLLPEQSYSLNKFYLVNNDLLEKKIVGISGGLNIIQVRQLLALEMGTTQRRKTYLGLCQWFRNSPSGGKSYSIRKKFFYEYVEVLEERGYIQVIDIPAGKQVRLTAEGENLCNNINQFLTSYYQRIYSQFNLVPCM